LRLKTKKSFWTVYQKDFNTWIYKEITSFAFGNGI